MEKEFLEDLISQHQTDIYRYMRFLGAQDADAEDLTQEAFMAAFRNQNGPVEGSRSEWSAWLRGIGRNLFLGLLRKKSREYAAVNAEDLQEAEDIWQREMNSDKGSDLNLEALKKCMEDLPEREKQAIEMRYHYKLSRQEMGARLKMAENSVKSFLRRLRTALGECIKRRIAERGSNGL